jgi:DNA-binding NtrC family response regulator
VEAVAAVLRNLAREVALHREVEGLRRAVQERFSADRLIGNSPRMREVRRLLREAAEVDATVLLTGRSGTGKEVAARAIHFGGPRAAGPFVPVNCAAIPEPLFESAMFGHRRGAFTGASENHAGLAEQSSGGTLFLDEVAEIPLPQQAKLLRVLQESEVTPVGSQRPVSVDLRVVAATNRDLEALVRAERFRKDLLFRIDIVRVDLPSLRERREDIALLVAHFLEHARVAPGAVAPRMSAAVMRVLLSYPWPGNVRELEHAIEHAVLVARGEEILPDDLPPRLRDAGTQKSAWEEVGLGSSYREAKLAFERAYVKDVLERAGGSISQAARLAGIHRGTFHEKLNKLGLAEGGGGGAGGVDEDD